ncbi:MAG: P1 family peptidase, partial [Bradyrhizobium sp.]|nr:P1 family peptidase [Bradyrhizobium sp.]
MNASSIAARMAAAWILAVGFFDNVASAADQANLVPNTEITGPVLKFDWPAIEIGVGSYEEGPTGLTVIRFPKRASVTVDVRGGGPGTVNTDLLRLGYGGQFIDAIVLSGGSAYGEETITAVATGLKDSGIRSGDFFDVAIVPGAIIYDFGGRRFNEIYPDKRLAQAALHTLRPGVFPLGAQGAGRMAMQGSYFGCNVHSGEGGAFRQIGATKIAAFTVVNAAGAITDRNGRLVECNKAKYWGNLATTSELLRNLPQSLAPDWKSANPPPDEGGTRNTTISLIVTNQKLDPASLQRLAIQVHTSMARAIQPFSTQNDGDTLYAASTQEVDNSELSAINLATIAGETMWDAVLASVPENAVSVRPPQQPASVTPEQLAAYAGTYEFGSMLSGAFGGLGADVRLEDGQFKLAPIEGLPAARAGILAGDVVTQLNGEALKGSSLNSVAGKLRGPPGSAVVLTIARNGQDQPIDITVVRERLSLRALLRVKVEGDGLSVEAIGGRRVFDFENSKPATLIPLSNTEFYTDGRYATRMVFGRDLAGKVTGAILNPGRWEQ